MDGSYVEDLPRAGSKLFQKNCEITHERFETSGDDELPLLFVGFSIKRGINCPFPLEQQLQELDTNSHFADYRSMRMRLAWIANSRPEIAF